MNRRKQQQAVAPATADPVAVKAPEASLVECAVLHNCIYGKHDDIVSLPRAVAEAAAAAGDVDPHPNAIKAIRSRG